MEFRFHRKETTASTNADAREGRPGDVFVAEFQTAGRGRLDHEWHAARGENLTFSVVLDAADISPAEVATLPLVVGLAVARAVEALLGNSSQVAVKWPNDVLVGGRKIWKSNQSSSRMLPILLETLISVFPSASFVASVVTSSTAIRTSLPFKSSQFCTPTVFKTPQRLATAS